MAHTALVTGASSGIGEAFARALAGRGHDLILVARREDRLRALADELPTEARIIGCDLASEAPSVPAQVEALGLDVDLLVNNAGFGTYGRFHEIPEGRDAEMVRVNCEAVVTLTRAFLPDMVERGRGGVIVVASTSGNQPLPYTATYAATKAFAQFFAEALRQELRGSGVRALAVNPGPVPTEWQQVSGVSTRELGVPGEISAEQVAAEALDAFDRDRRSVIPGRVIRTFMRLSKPSPRSMQLRVTERLYRPRS
ncbi:MAG TPA: SDR family oxidoreductase [Solirubrobacterales bacterium]